MADKPIPTPELLRQLLRYEPETGRLFWRSCEESKRRNAFANKEAGTISSIGYRKIFVYYKQYAAHRIAWAMHYGAWPKAQLDHINHDRADNRIDNLREVTNAENRFNLSARTDNTSGTQGVFWEKRTSRWRATITKNGKKNHLGSFKSKDEAISAREAAAVAMGFHANHGHYAAKALRGSGT